MPAAVVHAHAGRNEAILYSHAVLGCLVWAFIVPVGGILIRLNLKSRWILRIHGYLQLTAFLAYVAAVGLGVWMCQNFSTKYWADPHVRLGLAILGMAFIMPPMGYIHHLIYKRRAADTAAGLPSKAPGSTILSTTHQWLGRLLIILGMINGGLGIRLGEKSPYQKRTVLRKAAIGYGVGCAVVALVYCAIVIPWEIKKHKRNARPTTYQEKPTTLTSSGEISPIDTDSEVIDRGNGRKTWVINGPGV